MLLKILRDLRSSIIFSCACFLSQKKEEQKKDVFSFAENIFLLTLDSNSCTCFLSPKRVEKKRRKKCYLLLKRLY